MIVLTFEDLASWRGMYLSKYNIKASYFTPTVNNTYGLITNSLVSGRNEQKTSDESALEFWSFVYVGLSLSMGFPGGSAVKNLPAMQEMWFNSLVGKISWRRKWQPTPTCLGNPTDRGAWQAIIHRVTRVKQNLVIKPSPSLSMTWSQREHFPLESTHWSLSFQNMAGSKWSVY